MRTTAPADHETLPGSPRRRGFRLLCRNRDGFGIRPFRMIRHPVHPAAPLFIIVPHAVLVMNCLVLMTAVENSPRLRTGLHRGALPLHADQIFVQIAAERTPDRIVMIDADLPLFRSIAL